MAITPKPSAKKQGLSEASVEALINRGGTSSQKEELKPDEVKLVQLRLSSSLLSKIDTSRSNKALKKPRHTWILEAILEKIEREDLTL